MRAPVGSPPGPAGASSSTRLPELLQALTWVPHLVIHSVPSLRPGRTPAATGTVSVLKPSEAEGERVQAQMVFLYIGLSVCLSAIHQVWGLCFYFLLWALASTSQDSRRRSTSSVWRDGGGTSMRACQTELCQYTDVKPQFQLSHVHICKYKHICIFNHKNTFCFDIKKHSHTHSVEIVFILSVDALSNCLTHTNCSQHICALWGPSPFTQLEVGHETFKHTC